MNPAVVNAKTVLGLGITLTSPISTVWEIDDDSINSAPCGNVAVRAMLSDHHDC